LKLATSEEIFGVKARFYGLFVNSCHHPKQEQATMP